MTDAQPAKAKKEKRPVPVRFDPKLGAFVDKDDNPIPKKPMPRPATVKRQDFRLDTRSVYDKDLLHVRDEAGRVSRDQDGYLTSNAGKKRLDIAPRKVYRRGAHFRVIGENVRMEAMCHYGAGANGGAIWSGWSRLLPVGTIVECIGWRRFRKDGLVAPQFVYGELPAEAKWSTVWPLDGIWRTWPLSGILEPVEQDAEGNWVASLVVTVSSNRSGEKVQ